MAIRDVIRNVPRTRQPQTPTGIDWGNPITKGLQFAVVPFSRLTEVVNNGVLTYDTGATYQDDVTGRGLFFNGTTDGISLPGSASSAYTVFGLVNINAANATRNVMSLGTGAAYAVQLRADSGNWSFYQSTATGGTDLLAGETGTVVAGKVTAIAGTWDGLSVISLYRDGLQRASTVALTIRGSTSARVGQDNFGAKQGWSGSIYIALMWARALTAAEHVSLAANPWQIFSPLIRKIWVPAAGGAASFAAASISIATAAAALTTTIRLAATSAATAITSAALTTATTLAAASTAIASAGAALSTAILFACTPAAQAFSTGALNTSIPVAAASTSQAASTGALATAIAPAGAGTTQASSTAALTTTITLAAAPSAQATTTAALTTSPAGISATSTAQASSSAALTTAIRIASTAAVQAASAGTITTAITFVSTAAAQAATSASISTAVSIAAAPSAQASSNAALTTNPASLTAASAAQASTTAGITTSITLATGGAAQASTAAGITTSITLVANGAGQASTTASLTAKSLGLATTSASSASCTGALTTAIGLFAGSAAVAVTSGVLTTATVPTTLTQDIQALLLPLASGGVWYGANTQEPPSYPYITWLDVSSSPNVSLQGPSLLQNTHIQIDIFSLYAAESQTIEVAIEAAFIASSITNVPLSSADQYEDMVRAYRITKEYSVWAVN